MDASTRDGYNSSPLDGSELEKGRDETLARIRTAGSVQISAELFEKLYLSPPNHVKGQFRSTFGNPTPM